MPLKTIHIALSPNNTWRDTLAAAELLFLPWNWFSWKKGRAVSRLEDLFRDRLGAKMTAAVGSGREALLLILKSLAPQSGEEVLVQSFTCMVVINSIIWNGLKPVYVDIDRHFNLDLTDLQKKISPRTRAVIIQHTFGIAGRVAELKKICRERGLVLIEDCAHALGASANGQMLGSQGDFSFFSLGRSKVISCVNGGILAVNNEKYIEPVKHHLAHLQDWSWQYILQNLAHPLIFSLAKPLYGIGLGKALIVLAQKLRLLNKEITPQEKRAVKPAEFNGRLANAMAKIALLQMAKLDDFNRQRRWAAEYYFKHLRVGGKLDPAALPGAIFLRYPLLISNPERVLSIGKKLGLYLGDWYSVPVAPPDIDQNKTLYQAGSCPETEKINRRMINLPTYQSLKKTDLKKICNLVNQYAEN